MSRGTPGRSGGTAIFMSRGTCGGAGGCVTSNPLGTCNKEISVTDTFDCARVYLGDSLRGVPAFAQLRARGPWPPTTTIAIHSYEGDLPGLREGDSYVVSVSPASAMSAEARLSLLREVWRLSDGSDLLFSPLFRAVAGSDGPYEVTGESAWAQVLKKSFPSSHPVWQFIKIGK